TQTAQDEILNHHGGHAGERAFLFRSMLQDRLAHVVALPTPAVLVVPLRRHAVAAVVADEPGEEGG
ncbi:MAG: hypothetical protein ACK559_00965, partial [bacterium]